MPYMLSRTLNYGRRAGIICPLGVESGFFVHLLAAEYRLTAVLFRKGPAWGFVRRWLFGSILAGSALRLVLEERR